MQCISSVNWQSRLLKAVLRWDPKGRYCSRVDNQQLSISLVSHVLDVWIFKAMQFPRCLEGLVLYKQLAALLTDLDCDTIY